jgi:hypothetical protein
MTERRVAPRQRSFLHGRIIFNNRRSSVDCLIRDISDRGAKLKFSEAVAIPEVIELFIPSKDETYKARVQWRSGDEAGVEFDAADRVRLHGHDTAVGAAGDLVARIVRLEAEIATLHRRVNELRNERRRVDGEL